ALAELRETGAVTLEAAADNGGWITVCHPGATPPRPALIRGEHDAEPIDDLLAWDQAGRWVVTREQGKPMLVDVITGDRTDLAALGFDDRDDALDRRPHRALAFDPRGEVLAYVRRRGAPELVLRARPGGDERLVKALPGEPWRMTWDQNGETLVVSVIAEDTTKNGSLDFPVRRRVAPRLACSGLLPKFRIGPEVGDRPTTVLVSRDGASVTLAPDFVAPFGRGFIARGRDGALSLVRGTVRQPLADAECLGRVLVADPSRSLALVSCTNDKPPPAPNGTKRPKRVGVELVGVGYRQELGVVVQPMALDRWPEMPRRLVPIYPGMETMLIDLDQRRALTLKPGDRVLATSGAHALVRRERALLAFDADQSTETPLVQNVAPFAGLVVSGSLAAVGTTLLDAAVPRVVGTLPGRPLLLTPSGDALVAEGGTASADAFARGPLRWHRATAPK
ncbi:MAG TPA: hypothetical protein VFV94_05850, partial [Polyangiaceae bacterium]|nr:hypothetical protein [Polyangiaceae bacterium]